MLEGRVDCYSRNRVLLAGTASSREHRHLVLRCSQEATQVLTGQCRTQESSTNAKYAISVTSETE